MNKYLFAWCLCIWSINNGAFAQKSEYSFDAVAYKKTCKRFYDKKIGEVFQPVDDWISLNGSFDLGAVVTPTIIFLGYASCQPCRAALPVFSDISTESKYSKFNFVYMTLDDTTTLKKELSELVNSGRVVAIPLSKDYINQMEIAIGYPTIYFINSRKVVKAIYAFGEKDGPIDSKAYWYTLLDALD
jgi:thiol-disulfide isomerase/thioredoxin